MQFSTTHRYIGWGVVAALFCICIALGIAVWSVTPRHTLTFAVMDVGQGDALYIESPRGVQVLIDGGPGSAVLRELPLLMPYGDRSIDAVIETHPDADHIGGLVAVLKRYRVGAFIEPGIPKSTATAQTLVKTVADERIPRYIARSGMVLDLGSGARLEILYPDHDVSNLASNKVNEGGVVAHLVYGESEVLLMADVPAKIEQYLTSVEGEKLRSDIVKVSHHGSKTSTSEALLGAVQPNIAVISVGARNRYGHPNDEVLERLARHGVTVLRTDKQGSIVCSSSGDHFTCK